MNTVIEVNGLTKDYGNNCGIFDVNLKIEKGESFGLVGSNGAGKTTLIRSIMGFLKPTRGSASVCGLDSWNQPEAIKKYIGYVPGEIAFPDLGKGTVFIKSQAEFLGLKDLGYAKELVKILQIDLSADLKRMSKGMKQKTALVAALMNDADILILDEPSTGLDPLMRVSFIDVILRERKKGKTIIMSSHLFSELEQTCDRVALIHKGKIIDIADVNKIHARTDKEFKIEFNTRKGYLDFKKKKYTIIRDQEEYAQVTVSLNQDDINRLFNDLSGLDLKFIAEVEYTLEKQFRNTLSATKKEIINDK